MPVGSGGVRGPHTRIWDEVTHCLRTWVPRAGCSPLRFLLRRRSSMWVGGRGSVTDVNVIRAAGDRLPAHAREPECAPVGPWSLWFLAEDAARADNVPGPVLRGLRAEQGGPAPRIRGGRAEARRSVVLGGQGGPCSKSHGRAAQGWGPHHQGSASGQRARSVPELCPLGCAETPEGKV